MELLKAGCRLDELGARSIRAGQWAALPGAQKAAGQQKVPTVREGGRERQLWRWAQQADAAARGDEHAARCGEERARPATKHSPVSRCVRERLHRKRQRGVDRAVYLQPVGHHRDHIPGMPSRCQ